MDAFVSGGSFGPLLLLGVRFHLLMLALFALLFAPSVGATGDPDRDWFTLETPHFAIHSYDGGEPLARRVAAFAEEAYARVNPLLGFTPSERTHIALVDDVDAANGFAAVIPYSGITLYASPPLPGDTLASYVDWLRLLVFHEYAHVVHLNTASGLPEALNGVFGKTFKPNQMLPRWFTEGIATWVESRVSSAGRVGSSRFEMFLRAQALADVMPELSELSGVPLRPPGATHWYLYGSDLVRTIVEGAGSAGLRRFTASYGRRMIPFGVSLALKKSTGKGLGAWYDLMIQHAKDRARAVMKRVDRAGRMEGEQLTRGGFTKGQPQFSPDGRHIAYLRSDGHGPAYLVLAEAKSPQRFSKWVRCDGGCGGFSWRPDGREVLLSTNRYHRRVNLHTDLVAVPLPPGEASERLPVDMADTRRLTHHARFSQPAVQHDGRLVWGVATQWGKTRLEGRDARNGSLRHTFHPPAYGRLSHPAPTSNGRFVYVSMHHGGNHDLYRLTTASGAWARLTRGAAIEQDLRLSPDERWLLYVSDPDGVFNVYARELATGTTRRLTQVVTGAFSPAVSPDGRELVFTLWTAEGDELHRLPFDPSAATVIDRADPRPLHVPSADPRTRVTRNDYRPIATLLPRSLYVSAMGDAEGVSSLTLSMGSTEITERISGTLMSVVDLRREDASFEGALHLGTSWPDLSLGVGRLTRDLVARVGDRSSPYREEVTYASVDVEWAFPSVHIASHLRGGLMVQGLRSARGFRAQHTPEENTPFIPGEGITTRLYLGGGFSTVKRATLNISPSRGMAGTFSGGWRSLAFGSYAQLFNIDLSLAAYVPLPGADDHVWAMRWKGGWRGGDPDWSRPYLLGGAPQQDVLMNIVTQTQGESVWLRGFSPDAFWGDTYQLWVNEWRFPLVRGRRGLDALPIFVKDLHGSVFADVGLIGDLMAFENALKAPRVGVGAELRLDIELLFGLTLNFRLGYAHGFGPQGGDHLYFLVAPPP